MGIEHLQMEAIQSIASQSIDKNMNKAIYSQGGKKTPNQRALAASIALSMRRYIDGISKSSIDDVNSIFDAMDRSGHQSVAVGYGNEQLCPDPHSELWNAAMANILFEARIQKLDQIKTRALRYYADHLKVIDSFWSPKGVRIAGSRAKNQDGLPLIPNWSIDSWMYKEILGGDQRQKNIPNLLKPNRFTLDLLFDSVECWKDIRNLYKNSKPFLGIPVNKWNTSDGGFISALSFQINLNDPLAWVIVDGKGDIKAASHTLDDFIKPDRNPDLIVGN